MHLIKYANSSFVFYTIRVQIPSKSYLLFSHLYFALSSIWFTKYLAMHNFWNKSFLYFGKFYLMYTMSYYIMSYIFN